jgi:hypothetical protein
VVTLASVAPLAAAVDPFSLLSLVLLFSSFQPAERAREVAT